MRNHHGNAFCFCCFTPKWVQVVQCQNISFAFYIFQKLIKNQKTEQSHWTSRLPLFVIFWIVASSFLFQKVSGVLPLAFASFYSCSSTNAHCLVQLQPSTVCHKLLKQSRVFDTGSHQRSKQNWTTKEETGNCTASSNMEEGKRRM